MSKKRYVLRTRDTATYPVRDTARQQQCSAKNQTRRTDFAAIDSALPERLRLPASDEADPPRACSLFVLNPAWLLRPIVAVAGRTTETNAAPGRQMKSNAPRSAILRLCSLAMIIFLSTRESGPLLY